MDADAAVVVLSALSAVASLAALVAVRRTCACERFQRELDRTTAELREARRALAEALRRGR